MNDTDNLNNSLSVSGYQMGQAEYDSETSSVIASLEEELEASFSTDNQIDEVDYVEVVQEEEEDFSEIDYVMSDMELGDLVFGSIDPINAPIGNLSTDDAVKGKAMDEGRFTQSEINKVDLTDIDEILIAKKKEVHSRFSGSSWYDAIQKQDIIIAGIGGIGSWTSFLISKTSPSSMLLYDGDSFETGNMSGQLCFNDQMGQNKAYALRDHISRASNYHRVSYIGAMYTEQSDYAKVMICGFDNMAARKIFYNVWKKNNEGDPDALFIDGRMTINVFQVFSITGVDTESMIAYEREHLFGDGEAESPLCSLKQTSYMAAMIGGVINNVLVNFCNNLNEDNPPYRVPFFIEFNSAVLRLEVK